MWAGAGRNLLREPPQGHRRKLSATLRGFREARASEASDDDPVWQPTTRRSFRSVRGFSPVDNPSTLEETSFEMYRTGPSLL